MDQFGHLSRRLLGVRFCYPQEGNRVRCMVLTLVSLVLLELLVDLQKDAETEVIPHDLELRQVLHKLVHQLQPGRCVHGMGL